MGWDGRLPDTDRYSVTQVSRPWSQGVNEREAHRTTRIALGGPRASVLAHIMPEGQSGAPKRRKKLKWYQLVGVTFFAVCGGDYGIEDTVGAAGSRLTLLGLVVLPWIWSLPIALMTAELSSMIPESGGYVVWVHRAFGPFWAHQNAVWNLVANAFDNALYPVMFVDYLQYFPLFRSLDGWSRWFVELLMLAAVTMLNLLGVDVVADASTLFAGLVISPFAALVVCGLPDLNVTALTRPFSGKHIHWGTYLSVLLWNTSGYDSVGALAAEVESPGKAFPRAMIATILLVSLVYILPLSVAISLDHQNLQKWSDGHFTVVAQQHVGDWLSAWIAIGGALSAVGLLNTLLCTAARVTASAAKLRVVPTMLAKTDKKGLPRRATITISVVLAFACALPFSELVSISMLFYGATTAFEFSAMLVLRHAEPDTPRPYRIPLDRRCLALAYTPPLLLCLLLIALAPLAAWVLFILSVALGLGTYYVAHGCSLHAARGCYRPQPAHAALCGAGVLSPRTPKQAHAQKSPSFLFKSSGGRGGGSGGGYGQLRTNELNGSQPVSPHADGDEGGIMLAEECGEASGAAAANAAHRSDDPAAFERAGHRPVGGPGPLDAPIAISVQRGHSSGSNGGGGSGGGKRGSPATPCSERRGATPPMTIVVPGSGTTMPPSAPGSSHSEDAHNAFASPALNTPALEREASARLLASGSTWSARG